MSLRPCVDIFNKSYTPTDVFLISFYTNIPWIEQFRFDKIMLHLCFLGKHFTFSGFYNYTPVFGCYANG